jgi:hypothetical protein
MSLSAEEAVEPSFIPPSQRDLRSLTPLTSSICDSHCFVPKEFDDGEMSVVRSVRAVDGEESAFLFLSDIVEEQLPVLREKHIVGHTFCNSSYSRSWLLQLKTNMSAASYIFNIIKSLNILKSLPINAEPVTASMDKPLEEAAKNHLITFHKSVIIAQVHELYSQSGFCDVLSEVVKIHSAAAITLQQDDEATRFVDYHPKRQNMYSVAHAKSPSSPRSSISSPCTPPQTPMSSSTVPLSGFGGGGGYQASLSVLEAALMALSSCLVSGGSICNEVLCNVAMTAIIQHENSLKIVSPALLVIALLCCNEENKVVLAQLSLTSMLGSVCLRFVESSFCFESGILAISGLCSNSSQREILTSSDSGVFIAIYHGLRLHHKKNRSALSILQCLIKLCVDEENAIGGALPGLKLEERVRFCHLVVQVLDGHYHNQLTGKGRQSNEIVLSAFKVMELFCGKFSVSHETIESSTFVTEHIDAFTRANICDVTIKILRSCIEMRFHNPLSEEEDERILVAGCRILLLESMYSVDSRNMLFDCGVCDLVASILLGPFRNVFDSSGYLSTSVVDVLLRTITSLLTNNFSPIKTMSLALCDVFQSLYRTHAKSESLVVQGLHCMALLGDISMENKLALCGNGTVNLIIRLMHMHNVSLAVVEMGFTALASISKDLFSMCSVGGSSNSSNGSSARGGAHGPSTSQTIIETLDQPIISSSRQHTEDWFHSPIDSPQQSRSPSSRIPHNSVQLGNIHSDSASHISSPNNSGNQGIISLSAAECNELMHSLRTYTAATGSIPVITAGLVALRHLTENHSIKSTLLRHGIAVAIVDILKQHQGNVAICTFGLWVVNVLAYKSTANNFSTANVALKSAGVHAVVVNILLAHMDDVELIEAGLRAISVLGANSVCRSTLAAAGACNIVVSLLQRHVAVSDVSVAHTDPASHVFVTLQPHPLVARYGCAALYQLIIGNSVNATQLRLMGCKAMLRTLILNNPLVTDEWTKQRAKEIVFLLNKVV